MEREEDATTKRKQHVMEAPEAAADSDAINPDGGSADTEGPEELPDLADLAEIEELEGDDEEELDVDALDADDDGSDYVDEDDTEEEESDEPADAEAADTRTRKATAESPEAETDEDDDLTDEVEASLDVILAERLRGDDLEDEEQEEDEEDDAPGQLATVIPVRQPHEFLCQSCFLLKPPGQLADRDHQLCRDCA